MAKKSPNPIDRYVGARVRMRRKMIGWSQEKLGSALDLTFQQVQKYEKGSNRIGSSRLAQIAAAMQVTPGFFFEGAPGQVTEVGGVVDYTAGYLNTSDGLALTKAFVAIKSTDMRRRIVDLAEALALEGL